MLQPGVQQGQENWSGEAKGQRVGLKDKPQKAPVSL